MQTIGPSRGQRADGGGGNGPDLRLGGNYTNISDGTTPLTYDAWNRLMSYARGTGVHVSYAYDGLGRRIRTDDSANAFAVFAMGDRQGAVISREAAH